MHDGDALILLVVFAIFICLPLVLWYWSYKHKKKHGLKGAMGWLLVFNLYILWVWYTQALNIGGHMVKFVQKNIPQENIDFIMEYTHINGKVILYLLLSGGMIIYRVIWKQQDASTPQKVIFWLWMGWPLATLVSYFLLLIKGLEINLTLFLAQMITILSITGAWTLYFKNAIRVKNTYAIAYDANQQNKKYVTAIVLLVIIFVVSWYWVKAIKESLGFAM